MNKRTIISPHWRWTSCCLIGIAVLVLLLIHHGAVPAMSQDQSTTSAQPAESQPKAQEQAPPLPEAKPAEGKQEATQPSAQKEEKPAAAEKKEPEELTNQSCLECHNADILKMSKEDLADQVVVSDKPAPPKTKPLYVFGELNLAINEKKYADGVHADTTCVTCHKDVSEVPHPQRLKSVDCKECHEDFVESIRASAHGEKAGPKAPKCTGCHDAHYGKGQSAYQKEFQRKVCEDCHKAYGMDTLKGHTKVYEARMHLASLDCMTCHHGKEPGVHNIAAVKTQVASCESCHNKRTTLSKAKREPIGLLAYIQQTTFINNDVRKKFDYVIGANRIPALDAIIILAVIAPLGLPLVHGGLRILTRRKGPLHLPEEKILLHPFIERIWHWFQALCIVMLILTGIILHWPEKFPGWFNWAVDIHNWFGWAAVIAFLLWLVYNLITGRITHYFPKKGEIPGGMIKQAKFYGYGIFKHEPHPYAPTEDNKFNPLQKIAYLQFQVLLLPILLLSGLVYMYPETFKGFINAIGGMTVVAVVHYILGALFTAFLVAHLYLATTGETIGENFKAIVFGYGVKSDHGKHHG
jgi:predicted CXXCH cytochrome family protein